MSEILLHTTVLTSGERFPVLVDHNGIPLQFPLAFSLRDRQKGGVARLKQRLRRIRDLYLAFRAFQIDLDVAILYRDVDIRTVEIALHWLEEEHEEDSTAPSASMRNQRIKAWTDFLAWSIETSNWTLRTNPNTAQVEQDVAERLRILLDDHRLSTTTTREISPLSSREIEILDELLGPNDHGVFGNSPFGARAAERTWILYQVQRWGGLRLGEALKLQIGDVPPRETDADAILREVDGSALAIEVHRRVDDLLDSRTGEPGVKRFGRRVALPDSVIAFLWDYRDQLPETTPYLVRTADGAHPLSYSQASKLAYPIRPAAARMFEARYPGDAHTLSSFHWHRLRHTRAVEMLPEYFPDGQADSIRQRQFCEAFGWAFMESAEPYLRLLYRRDGEARWRQSLNNLEP